MRKLMFVLGSVAALAIGLVAVSMAGDKLSEPMTIRVVEHATTDRVIDIGKPGDSTGDVLTFHNVLYDETNSHRVGKNQGECTRIAPVHGTWLCRWTSWIGDQGSITVEGLFSDNGPTVLAVTGGTGMFKNARGSMKLGFRNDPAEFDFIYRLIP